MIFEYDSYSNHKLFVNISPITISIYGYMEISAELYAIKQ